MKKTTAVTIDIEKEEDPSIPASSADAPDIIHLPSVTNSFHILSLKNKSWTFIPLETTSLGPL